MFPPLKNKIMSLFHTYYCYFRNHDFKLWIQCKKSKFMFFVHNSVWILVITQNKILWEPLKNVVWLNVFKNYILIIMYESSQLNNIYFWLGDVIGDYFMSFSIKLITFFCFNSQYVILKCWQKLCAEVVSISFLLFYCTYM